MKIEHLWYLKEIANSKSISAAAKRLFVGQTTLSAVIKSIEEEFHIQLFERTATGIKKTEIGEQFLAQANIIIDKYETMLKEYSNGSFSNGVHFLGDSSSLEYFAPYVCNLVQLRFDGTPIVIHETSRQKLASEIIRGTANLGITHLDTSNELKKAEDYARRNNLTLKLIARDRFYLCCRADSKKFAGRDSVSFDELKTEKYIAPRYYTTVPNQTKAGDAFRTLNCVAIVPNSSLVKQIILDWKDGDVFTILGGMTLINSAHILHRDIVAIPLVNVPYAQDLCVFLISKGRSLLSKKEQLIYDSLVEYGKQALSNNTDSQERYISTRIL